MADENEKTQALTSAGKSLGWFVNHLEKPQGTIMNNKDYKSYFRPGGLQCTLRQPKDRVG
jgi:hypothetical protein